MQGDRTTVGDHLLEDSLAALELHDELKVLDLGCGFGRLFPFLNRWRTDLYGTDISAAMIEEAQKAHGNIVSELAWKKRRKVPFLATFSIELSAEGGI